MGSSQVQCDPVRHLSTTVSQGLAWGFIGDPVVGPRPESTGGPPGSDGALSWVLLDGLAVVSVATVVVVPVAKTLEGGGQEAR